MPDSLNGLQAALADRDYIESEIGTGSPDSGQNVAEAPDTPQIQNTRVSASMPRGGASFRQRKRSLSVAWGGTVAEKFTLSGVET